MVGRDATGLSVVSVANRRSMALMITDAVHQLRRVRAGVPERRDLAGRGDLRHRSREVHRVRRPLREPQCVKVCPVDCIPLDPDHVETKEQLHAKYLKLTGKKT